MSFISPQIVKRVRLGDTFGPEGDVTRCPRKLDLEYEWCQEFKSKAVNRGLLRKLLIHTHILRTHVCIYTHTYIFVCMCI